MSRYFELRRELLDKFTSAGIESAGVEADILISELAGFNRAELFLQSDATVPADLEKRIRALGQRRAGREPLQYLLGYAYFMNIRLDVSPEVLIPRPETECLVEWAVDTLPQGGSLLDLGTGSGRPSLSPWPTNGRRRDYGGRRQHACALHRSAQRRTAPADAGPLSRIRPLRRGRRGKVRPDRRQPAVCDRRRVRRARTGGARARTAARADRSRRRFRPDPPRRRRGCAAPESRRQNHLRARPGPGSASRRAGSPRPARSGRSPPCRITRTASGFITACRSEEAGTEAAG